MGYFKNLDIKRTATDEFTTPSRYTDQATGITWEKVGGDWERVVEPNPWSEEGLRDFFVGITPNQRLIEAAMNAADGGA